MEIVETEDDEFNVDVPCDVIENFESFENLEKTFKTPQVEDKDEEREDDEEGEEEQEEEEIEPDEEIDIRKMSKKDMHKFKYIKRQKQLSPLPKDSKPAYHKYATKMPAGYSKKPDPAETYRIGKKSFNRTKRKKKGRISKASLMCLARRAGVQRISKIIYPIYRNAAKEFLKDALGAAVAYTDHAKRKTVTVQDIMLGLKHIGRPVYVARDKKCYFTN